ncbi:MAG TPA: hypothetical protein VF281_01140 [Candidatus Saccharimonadales bacterium]
MDKLSTAETKRYGELKPPELDGNVFGYHLKNLLTEKYISKDEDGAYALTLTGKDYLVHRYENPILQAHSIFLIAVRRGDEWLMRERLVQPLLGMTGFIHGEPIADEPLLDTAQRRLLDKTGLSSSLSIFSSGLIKITRNETIESFAHAIILTGHTDEDFTINDDQTGRQFWQSTSTLSQSSILPSCSDIATRITAGDNSTFILEYNL